MHTPTVWTGRRCFEHAFEILSDRPHARVVSLKGAERREEPADRASFLPGVVAYERALVMDVVGKEPVTWAFAVGTLTPSAAIKHERDLPLGDLALFRFTPDERRQPIERDAELIARLLADPSRRTTFLSLTRSGDVRFCGTDDLAHTGRHALELLASNRRDIAPESDEPGRLACFRYDPNVSAWLAQLAMERITFPHPATPDSLTRR